MNENTLFAIGLMSGTSLDGIDLVYVKFLKKDLSFFDILHAETIPYNLEWKKKLQNAIHFSSKELGVLDHIYGQHLGNVLQDFISKYHIKIIDFN